MIKDMFINFSVLTLFIMAGSWFLRHYYAAGRHFRVFGIGVFAGIAGIALMYFSVHVTASTIMDARQIVLLTAAYFGGLPAALFSGAIMALYRVLYFGVNDSSVTAAVNMLVMAVGTAWIARRVAAFYLKWLAMMLFTLLTTMLSLAFLLHASLAGLLPYFIPFTLVSGLYAMFVIEHQIRVNEKQRLHLTLERMIRAFNEARDSREIYRIALANLVSLFEAEYGSIQLIRNGRAELIGRYEHGVYSSGDSQERDTAANEIVAETILGRTKIYSNWNRKKPRDPARNYYLGDDVRSSIHAPLFHEGRSVGLISLGSVMPGSFGGKQSGVIAYLHPLISMVTAQKEAEEKFRIVSEASSDAIVVGDEHAVITYWNAGAERMFGWTEKEMVGRRMTDMLPERLRESQLESFSRYLDTGISSLLSRTTEQTGLRSDGAEFAMELSLNKWENAGATHYVAIVRDSSIRKKTERALQLSEMRYRRLIEMSPDAVYVIVGSKLVFVNGQGVRLLGAEDEAELLDRDVRSFVDETFLEEAAVSFAPLSESGKPVGKLESRYFRLDGVPVEVEVSAALIPYDEGMGIMVVSRDITERKLAESKLKEANRTLESLASKDGLTGIANRRHFDERLASEWGRSARQSAPLSLIICDIDFFKAYNDTYGHQGGDECLKLTARTIGGVTQRADDLAARYGGEEFVLLLPDTDREGAASVAERLRHEVESLEMPHRASKIGNRVTVSIGVSTMIPTARLEPGVLVDSADKALYRAKLEGRNRVVAASGV